MKIFGARADGTLLISMLSGQVNLLHPSLSVISPCFDEALADDLGPWRTVIAGPTVRRAVQKTAESARTVQMTWFAARAERQMIYSLYGTSEGATKGWDTRGRGRRKDPIKTRDIGHAVELILKGEVVELEDTRAAFTVVSRLAEIGKDAEAKGEKAPHYDLCNVSVPGTNLFCADKLSTEKFPDGVPRLEMPQAKGEPVPGSEADKLPRDKKGEIDGTPAFLKHLADAGIKTESGTVPASKLRASQAELVGSNVAQMMAAKGWDPGKDPIFVSRDNYVVDGHHRWAAVVARDAEDGNWDKSMNVVKIDAPISEVLHIAKAWADSFGIAPKSGKAKK